MNQFFPTAYIWCPHNLIKLYLSAPQQLIATTKQYKCKTSQPLKINTAGSEENTTKARWKQWPNKKKEA